MVYPEKPLTKDTWRLGGKQNRGKFRLGSRDASNYWQENLEHWERDESSPETSPRQSREKRSIPSHNGGSGKRTESRYSESVDSKASVNVSRDFVHHPGFQGSEPAKLKVGKKVSKFSSKSESAASTQNTFRPKGFGSLYDEMEFERRYKKVFDVNNHIHFVHSNYISGHKISKRSKLPPIGYVPGLQADSQENLDVFAIMSVQKYNHPDGASVTTPGSQASPRKDNENNRSIEVPPGFIPSPAKSYSKSPFNGIKGTPPHNITPRGTHMFRLPTLSRDDPEDASGQIGEDSGLNISATETITPLSDRSYRSKKSKKSKLPDNSRVKKELAKKKKFRNEMGPEDNDDTDTHTDDMEPFTFSVKVKIKPRDPNYQPVDTEEPDCKEFENNEYITDTFLPNRRDHVSNDRIMYPSYDDELNSEIIDNGDRVLKPKNISITTNEFGIVSKKVQYPERFCIDNSLAEVDESKLSESETGHLQVPLNPDANRHHMKEGGRNNNNLSSEHSVPEIRTTCPTPEEGRAILTPKGNGNVLSSEKETAKHPDGGRDENVMDVESNNKS